MSEYQTCHVCRDGSCAECNGDGGWETPAAPPYPAKWQTCVPCMGTGICQSCLGQVTTLYPFAGAILPVLPNDLETWETMLFSM